MLAAKRSNGPSIEFVCGAERLVQVPNCVIYSFGVEQQSSFEAALLKRSPHCKIWAYDFSVTSVRSQKTSRLINAHSLIFQIGPEIRNDPALNPRVKFTPYRFDE